MTIQKITSQSTTQELDEILKTLNTDPKKTLTTKLTVKKKDGFLLGSIKCFLVKILRFPIALTRQEDVARKLQQFAQKNPNFIEPQNKENFAKIFAKVLHIQVDPVSFKAVRTPDFSKALTKSCDLFDSCFIQTPPPKKNNPLEIQTYLNRIASLKYFEKVQDAKGIPETELRKRYEGIVDAFPFDNNNLQLLRDVARIMLEFKFNDLYNQLNTKVQQNNLEIPIDPDLRRHRINAEIKTVQRNEMRTLDGATVPADSKPVPCVVLPGTCGKNFGLKIVSELEHDFLDLSVLSIDINGKTKEVCVSKKELEEERLLLDLNGKISLIGEADAFQQYIEESDHALVLQNIERLLEKQKKHKKHFQFDLPKLILGIFETRKMNRIDCAKGMPSGRLSFLHQQPGLDNLVFGIKNDKVNIYDLTQQSLIAEGGESSVYRIHNFVTGKLAVMKKFNGRSVSATREMDISEKLYEGRTEDIPGIIKPFHGGFDSGDSINIQSEYEGDLTKLFSLGENAAKELPYQLSVDQKIELFYELLVGFAYCVEKQEFIHRDIKPANVFYKKDKAGKLHFFLGDFGAASVKTDFSTNLIKYQAPFTPRYITKENLREREEKGKKYFGEHGPSHYPITTNAKNDAKEYVNFDMKIDIFALGCLFADIMTTSKKDYMKRPLDRNGYEDYHNYPTAGSFKKKILQKNGCPVEFCNLAEQMLLADPLLRPDIKKVVNTFKSEMNARGLNTNVVV